MKTNPLLKWLLIPMALLLVFVGIQLFSGDRGGKPALRDPTNSLTPEEMKALGIEGDTPRDTVATLVAQVKQLRAELHGAVGDNRQQRAENDRLRAREGAIEQRIQTALDGQSRRLQQERDQLVSDKEHTQGLLQDLQQRLDSLSTRVVRQADLPLGLGLEDGDGKRLGLPGHVGSGSSRSGTDWIEPLDAKPDSAASKEPGFPRRFGPAQKTLSQPVDSLADIDTGAGAKTMNATNAVVLSTKPVYTVPSNSTLMGSVAMTALIGRVPIDGTVNDPYPFKVLIGPDNLSANGIDIPDVAGAVVSGTASGDWTLSCVRGQIRSVTFVFQDGTIRTMAQDGSKGGAGAGSSANTNTQSGLGWISDPQGIPCVSGERRSNARQYLGSQALLTAAGAGTASLIESDNGRIAVVANSNGSLGTVGISGNEAMGRILTAGMRDMVDWVNKLYGQAFAAIYVPPGAKVAVHLEQPLDIDYDARGRRVNHRIGGLHAPDMD